MCPLSSSAVDVLLRCVSESTGVAVAPWELLAAGAPKKKRGFRGGDPQAIGAVGGAASREVPPTSPSTNARV